MHVRHHALGPPGAPSTGQMLALQKFGPAHLSRPVKLGRFANLSLCLSTRNLRETQYQVYCSVHTNCAPYTQTNRRLLHQARALNTIATRKQHIVEPATKKRRMEGASALSGLNSSPSDSNQPRTQLLSVAPMMEWTDVHCRQLHRLISKHTYLYTEMVVDSTIIHTSNLDRFLWFPPEQKPIVCQLGGSNPETLAKSAAVVESYGYDEINLNCGCPSDRVAGAGCFGAKLMLNPELVAECCSAMSAACKLPITVKCRIGVDKIDDYASLCSFIKTVAEKGGVTHFIIHARKCILKGLSPAQNRTVPPLRRGWVFALKRDFPDLDFSLNGVVDGCHEAAAVIEHQHAGQNLHGVMIGRAAYHYPWHSLSDADRSVFGCSSNAASSRRQVFEDYAKYGDSVVGKWGSKSDGSPYPSIRAVVKPLLGMLHGERGTKRYKQELDRILKGVDQKEGITVSKVIAEALKVVPPEVLDAPPQVLKKPQLTFEDIPQTPADMDLNLGTEASDLLVTQQSESASQSVCEPLLAPSRVQQRAEVDAHDQQKDNQAGQAVVLASQVGPVDCWQDGVGHDASNDCLKAAEKGHMAVDEDPRHVLALRSDRKSKGKLPNSFSWTSYANSSSVPDSLDSQDDWVIVDHEKQTRQLPSQN